MDNRLILCCLVFLFTLLPVTAQSIDSDNVIITSAEETYTFSLESGNPVLHVRLSTEYEATKAGERIQVATYYGKYITIDKASAGSLFNKALYQQVIPENVFYDDTKVCFFNLYFDRKGKKAEVTFEKTYHDIRYFTSVYLPDIYFVKQKKINIIIPPGLNINLLEQNFSSNITVKKVLDAKTGNTIYTYFVTDQKPFKKEYSMPGRAFVYPHLLVLGAFISYHDLYHWLSGLVDTEDSSVVRQKALAITEGCLSEEQKIEAVYAWVQKNIRGRVYTGAIGLGMTIPALMLLGFGESFMAVVGAGLLFGIGFGIFDANNMPILCQFISAKYRGTAYGIMNMTGVFAGAAVTEQLGKWTDGGNLGIGFALLSIVVLAALLLQVYFLRPKTDNME